jgi:hypothetical protein
MYGSKMNRLTISALVWYFGCSFWLVHAQVDPVIGSESSGPTIWLESKTIDLGTIPVEQEIVTGTIMCMNEGSEPLEILKVSGPCACFLGSSGDKILPPGHGGEIEVKFDKEQIESGPVKNRENATSA